MKAVVAAFNQEKALVEAFSVITNLRMELFQALMSTHILLHPCHGTGSRKVGCMSSSPGLTRSVSVHLFVLYISSGPSNMFSADKNVSAMGLCRKVLKICTLLALEKDLLYFQSIYNLHIDFVKIVAFLLIIADRFRYIYYQRIEDIHLSICLI